MRDRGIPYLRAHSPAVNFCQGRRAPGARASRRAGSSPASRNWTLSSGDHTGGRWHEDHRSPGPAPCAARCKPTARSGKNGWCGRSISTRNIACAMISRAASRLDPDALPPGAVFHPHRDRCRPHRHRRPAAGDGGNLRRQAAAADPARPGPDRARKAVGPDAPHHGARAPGRRDAGDQRDRLRAVGPEGPLARPAGVSPDRRPDARQCPATPPCLASPYAIWAACGRAPRNTRRSATARRNGSSVTGR